ncbi:NAD(P)/FAD-dependent oxidoreductase [Paraburkholderia flagellata]|uniref:NAD(P)/FAD-dependent oxidoreductase n=1 Tax=Paraburkholderia flagellata TaxID=2883241 RepID=UPI001F38DAB5|nr:FAD-dependent oxidoreductase [Paraburkholderia flagellata]
MDCDFLIIGAGQAARRAAEALRERDPAARICMVGDEPHAPYDRPALSKAALQDDAGEARAFVRPLDDYAQLRIDLRLGTAVTALSPKQHTAMLGDGGQIRYSKVLLATGSRARTFPGPVAAAAPVHYLRTLGDARRLRAELRPGRRIVLVGGGFIGLEVAATAVTLGCTTTVLEPGERLLRRTMPAPVGEFIARLHRSRGVDLRLGVAVQGIEAGEDGTALLHTNAGAFVADVVVIGIGAEPNVELAAVAGIAVDDGIVVDEACRTSETDVFAAGDVTRHFNPLIGRHLRVESWQVAENQPVAAALAMLGESSSYAEWPWLWSDQFECNLQSLGLFEPEHTIVMRGEPEGGECSVLGLDRTGRLRAAATIDAGKDLAVWRRLASSGKPLDAGRLADPAVAPRSLI